MKRIPSESFIGAPCLKRDCEHDLQLLLAESRPVALRVFEKLVGFGNPERLAAAFEPVVEHDACDLAAFAGAGSVAEIIAATEAHRPFGVVERGGDRVEALIDEEGAGEETGMGFASVDDALELRVGEETRIDDAFGEMRPIGGLWRRDRRHGGGLHERRRMRLRALDRNRLHRVRVVKRSAERASFRRFPLAMLIAELDDLGRRDARGMGRDARARKQGRARRRREREQRCGTASRSKRGNGS